ncbi:MAG TPA: TonB-dependent receptor, partial [Gemmatimonadales bacterium]|nr:TonB-dependent receptor [Gemmatimonadales bacterium]
MPRPRYLLLLVPLLLGLARPVAGQVGANTDIITGTVTGPEGQPIADATVEATAAETQISRQRTTDARGRFTIVFPDGGGQYQILVRYIGMAPARLNLSRQADEDRLVVNVRMSPVATTLEEITVRGRVPRQRDEGAGPGSTERNLSQELVDRLPIDASDPNVLATLAPGVVAISGTDSTNAAFSVAGLRPDANNITLDGASFGSGSVPQDAVRNTRVVTNTYDVARGAFSGGLVASTTRSGTNVSQGSYTYTLRDRDLAWGGETSSPFGQGFTQNQLGGGMGGPIVHNRLFIFGALQGRWRDQALTSLTTVDPATLTRLGVSADSVARFLSLAGATGVPLTLPGIPDDRANNTGTGLVRLDWKPSDAQTITLRFDGHLTSQDPTRVGSLALPATGGTSSDHGGGVLGSLTSYFSGNFVNDFRAYLSVDHRDGSAYLTLPQGRVQVASDASDTTLGVTTFGFGGNAGFPQSSRNTSVELTEELSWLPGSASHRIKLGLYLNGAHFQQDQTPNQFGTFLYPSLGALEAGEPEQFTRNLAPLEQAGTAWNGAAYLGDTWRSRGFQLAYGARLETSAFSGAPAFNPAVDSAFGLRTDHVPSEIHLSPRVGFTWMLGGGGAGGVGAGATILRGGIGEFRSPTPTTLYSSALAAPGLSNAETQLVCIGAAVPIPDWSTYLQDPSAIPGDCTDTVTTVAVTPHPNVTVLDPGFSAPRAWRASLGIQRPILGTFSLSVDASWARGVSQYGFRDLNLATAPAFTLAAEGNRPVYVPASAIVPTTGALSPENARIDPAFGQVLEVESNLASETKQVTVGFGGVTGRGASFRVSYTYTRAEDQSSFSGGGGTQGFAAPTTAGNPNIPEWATSNFERRHAILTTITYPVTGALELTAIGRLSSGVPFTPLVGADINGDGARNDRAFVFNPATASDAAVAGAMQTLLATVPSGVRDCLESQLGAIAGRNSCTGPWQPSLDFQLNWRPSWFGLDRRLTVSVLT